MKHNKKLLELTIREDMRYYIRNLDIHKHQKMVEHLLNKYEAAGINLSEERQMYVNRVGNKKV
jgi:hypothetical protein